MVDGYDPKELERILHTMNDEQLEVCVKMGALLNAYREQMEKVEATVTDLKYMAFDLQCTRQERDELKAKLDKLGGSEG